MGFVDWIKSAHGGRNKWLLAVFAKTGRLCLSPSFRLSAVLEPWPATRSVFCLEESPRRVSNCETARLNRTAAFLADATHPCHHIWFPAGLTGLAVPGTCPEKAPTQLLKTMPD
jgi:hypothetical protein